MAATVKKKLSSCSALVVNLVLLHSGLQTHHIQATVNSLPNSMPSLHVKPRALAADSASAHV